MVEYGGWNGGVRTFPLIILRLVQDPSKTMGKSRFSFCFSLSPLLLPPLITFRSLLFACASHSSLYILERSKYTLHFLYILYMAEYDLYYGIFARIVQLEKGSVLENSPVKQHMTMCFLCGPRWAYIMNELFILCYFSSEASWELTPEVGGWQLEFFPARELLGVPAEAESQSARLAWDGRQPSRTWAQKQRKVRRWKPLPSNVRVTEDSLCW
jgi:hypothetical protein